MSSRGVAIVGVSHTDYAADFRNPSAAGAPAVARVVASALDDAGLAPALVDAVGWAGDLAAAPEEARRRVLGAAGLQPTTCRSVTFLGDAAELSRRAGVTVTAYTTAQRSSRRTYGGEGSSDYAPSYTYYHPWGFSSQGAHWALMFDHYRSVFPVSDQELGQVALALRQYAALNSYAAMRSPLTIDDYLAAPYVCRPLRRLDYCLPNDGTVALVLCSVERARTLGIPYVVVAGRGGRRIKDANDLGQMRTLILDAMHDLTRAATSDALAAGHASLDDIDHFQVYDASAVHVPLAIEAAGFCARGDGFRFVADGRIGAGRDLPTNTSGGMLSESYLHGWNLHVEAIRQLRGEAGARQVPGAHTSLYTQFWSGGAEAHVLIGVDGS